MSTFKAVPYEDSYKEAEWTYLKVRLCSLKNLNVLIMEKSIN